MLFTFPYFGEVVDPVIMELYAENFLSLLIKKIEQEQSKRAILEECITAIAVIASKITKQFGKYYDQANVLPACVDRWRRR